MISSNFTKRFVLFYILFFLCLQSAFASGYLEQAKSIFYGDARSKYEEAIKYIEQSNFDAAKESLGQFKDQLIKVNDFFLYIDHNKEALNNESQSLWNDFFNGSSSPWRKLNIYTTGLKQELGGSNYTNSLEAVKSSYKECGDAINKIYDFFKEYGKKTFGKQITIENIVRNHEYAKQLFIGETQSQYLDMTKYIEQSNFDAAKESAGRFKSQLDKIDDVYFHPIDHDKEALSNDDQRLWDDFYKGSDGPWKQLMIESGIIVSQLGKMSYNSTLQEVKRDYLKCGELINKIHDTYLNLTKGGSEKQKKMTEICDSCN